jgi:ERCC4-related helicase
MREGSHSIQDFFACIKKFYMAMSIAKARDALLNHSARMFSSKIARFESKQREKAKDAEDSRLKILETELFEKIRQHAQVALEQFPDHPKMDALIEQLREFRLTCTGRVMVFTSYRDSAMWITDYIRRQISDSKADSLIG